MSRTPRPVSSNPAATQAPVDASAEPGGESLPPTVPPAAAAAPVNPVRGSWDRALAAKMRARGQGMSSYTSGVDPKPTVSPESQQLFARNQGFNAAQPTSLGPTVPSQPAPALAGGPGLSSTPNAMALGRDRPHAAPYSMPQQNFELAQHDQQQAANKAEMLASRRPMAPKPSVAPQAPGYDPVAGWAKIDAARGPAKPATQIGGMPVQKQMGQVPALGTPQGLGKSVPHPAQVPGLPKIGAGPVPAAPGNRMEAGAASVPGIGKPIYDKVLSTYSKPQLYPNYPGTAVAGARDLDAQQGTMADHNAEVMAGKQLVRRPTTMLAGPADYSRSNNMALLRPDPTGGWIPLETPMNFPNDRTTIFNTHFFPDELDHGTFGHPLDMIRGADGMNPAARIDNSSPGPDIVGQRGAWEDSIRSLGVRRLFVMIMLDNSCKKVAMPPPLLRPAP